MTTKSKSVKTWSGLDPERAEQSAFLSPNAFIEALDELQAMGLPEWVAPNEAKMAATLQKRGEDALYAHFGKWVPSSYKSLEEKALAELEELAAERGWPVTPEEVLSSKVSTLQRLKELDAWKNQKRAELRAKFWEAFYKQVGRRDGKPIYRRFYTRHEREHTVKQLVDGRYQWMNAVVYELPPQLIEEIQIGKRRKWLKTETKTGSLEPSRYVFKAPDGKVVDLGKTDGKFKPCKRNGPDAAMQSIAKRLGRNIRGGAATILQKLIGRTDILPTYTTVWFNEGWVTFIGWQLDAKLTPATYVTTLEGKLVRAVNAPEDSERLTVSQAEYLLISKPSIGENDEESAEVDGTMELDQELVEQGFQRDRERYEVDADQFSDGLVLLERVAERMGRKVDFLCGDATWERREFRDTVAEVGREVHAERRQLILERRQIVSGRTQAWLDGDKVLAEDLTKSINKLNNRINRMQPEFRALVKDMFNQLVSRYERIERRDFGFCRMSALNFAREMPETIACASEVPANHALVPAKVVSEVERIVPSVNPLQLLQDGRSRVVEVAPGTYSTRMVKRAPVRHTTPKNASWRLKECLWKVQWGASPLGA